MIDKWFQTLKVRGIRYILRHSTITISKVQGPIMWWGMLAWHSTGKEREGDAWKGRL